MHHVLHVMRTLGTGGMERNTLRIVRALAAKEIRHSIALISNEKSVLDFEGVADVYRIIPRGRTPRTTWELSQLIRRLEPTAIHVRNLSMWPETVLARRLSGVRSPLIMSYHGSESGERSLPARRWLHRLLARDTNHIFAVSGAARADVAALHGVPIKKIEVLPNGVDLSRFRPQSFVARASRPIIIGNVGRLNSVKNLPILIRSLAELHRRGVDADLWIAGTGPERDKILALATELDVADRIQLLGCVEDVPGLLGELDIFVLSSDLEGQPNALLEAMATGLACVGTRVGGVPELLDHGRAGLLVERGDQSSLSNALTELAEDPQLRRELGHRARKRALAFYDESAMFDGYEALYRGARPGGERYEIVRADARDEHNVMRLLKRYITPRRCARRYSWLYRTNPQGAAATWLALERRTGQIVGLTSIFTREFVVGGSRATGSVGLDAFVRPDHRRRGIVGMLHHATHEAMKRGEIPHRFMCGPPVAANLGALLKSGSSLVGSAVYLHLPLTISGLLSLAPIPEMIRTPLARAGDHLFSPLSRLWQGLSRRAQARVEPPDRLARELDRLWEDLAPKNNVCGVRDARYVIWRYLKNPICTQTFVALEEHGVLRGWAVLERAPRGYLIVDHLFPEDADELLNALIAFAAREGASRLSLFTHADARGNDLFTGHGFVQGRSPSPFQVLCGDEELRSQLFDRSNWYLRAGDLDPESCRWSTPATPRIFTDPNYQSAPAGVPIVRCRS